MPAQQGMTPNQQAMMQQHQAMQLQQAMMQQNQAMQGERAMHQAMQLQQQMQVQQGTGHEMQGTEDAIGTKRDTDHGTNVSPQTMKHRRQDAGRESGGSLGSKIDKLVGAIDGLTNRFDRFESRIQTLEAQIGESFGEVKQEIEEVREEIDVLKDDIWNEEQERKEDLLVIAALPAKSGNDAGKTRTGAAPRGGLFECAVERLWAAWQTARKGPGAAIERRERIFRPLSYARARARRRRQSTASSIVSYVYM